MVAVAVTRTHTPAAELRAAAVRADDPRVARRALAIGMAMDGYPRTSAAELCGIDRQTLRDWVHRFNPDGRDGLADRPRPAHPASLSAEQQMEVAAWAQAGPNVETDGVVRWRRSDLSERIAERFGVTLNVRTVG